MNRRWVALAALSVILGGAPARAEESTDALFQSGVAALSKGALDDAVDRFELLADRGVTHPDASWDRALAYIRRAKTPGAHPGDLGRAAAALEETLLFRPDDAEAKFALDRVREEITHRRARTRSEDVERRPSLGWAVVGLFAEDTWATLALIASLTLTVSLAVRFLGKANATKLASNVAAGLSAILLLIAGSMTALAAWDRRETNLGVIISEDAHLLDENGVPVRTTSQSGRGSGGASYLAEGALVRLSKEKSVAGSLMKVEWGTLTGWVAAGEVRILSRP
ncbi:MAG TPA: hypothetical protein VHE30_12890 [Polyangiaceae bacterium]|nr:hypothetical protein [Polyangiaceae bacterium]